MGMFKFIGFSVILIFFICFPLIFSLSLGGLFSCVITRKYILLDSLSFYLIVLVFLLGTFSISLLSGYIDGRSLFFLLRRLIFTCLCFCTNHSILFWCFYEMSMLPLLYLIFRDSPYSERFIAGWYFCVYLLITSLPLILILLYVSFLKKRFYFRSWVFNSNYLAVYIVLTFVFFTKIPLSPFHTWLPIVHAEATSIVSIFLSGYIMKLGLLGVYRCSPFLFNGGWLFYLFVCACFSIFFILSSSSELDGKRWLAFLRLAHIVVPFLGFFVCSWDKIHLNFLYCLGHGLRAGLVFGFLWFFYDRRNSRNWVMLKTGVRGKITMSIVIVGLLSLCSFPPTLQFFCEVFLLLSSTFSFYYLFFWGFYLFFGGLVPLVLCSHLLIRNESVETSRYTTHGFLFLFLGLVIWCYFGVLFI